MSDDNSKMTVVEIMGHPDKPVSARCILSGCQDMTTNAAPQGVTGAAIPASGHAEPVGDETCLGSGGAGRDAEQAPAVAAPHPVVGEMVAAYKFRESMSNRRDHYIYGGALWHGWALEEAFHAGAKYAREASGIALSVDTLAKWRGAMDRYVPDSDAVASACGEIDDLLSASLKSAADRTDDKEGGP